MDCQAFTFISKIAANFFCSLRTTDIELYHLLLFYEKSKIKIGSFARFSLRRQVIRRLVFASSSSCSSSLPSPLRHLSRRPFVNFPVASSSSRPSPLRHLARHLVVALSSPSPLWYRCILSCVC